MADETFSLTTRIRSPAGEVFGWHERRGALERLCPPWARVRLPKSGGGGVRDGTRVTLHSGLGPFWIPWSLEHRDYVAGRQFRDVQLAGPFSKWEHLHLIEPDGPDACTLTDRIHYRPPGGAIGRMLGDGMVRGKLAQLMTWRHALTKADTELAVRYGRVPAKRVLIAGASGLIGGALAPFLQTQGHTVLRLVRRPAAAEDEISWDPVRGALDPASLDGIDAVVNLAGENIAAGRWNSGRTEAILRSRVDATRTLVVALQKLSRRPEVFVSASAVGYYGDRGGVELDEAAPIGQGFLPEVCLAWETHAEGAARLGMRTALLRFGVVLTAAGGALGKLLPIFRLGLGGRVGDGRQWMPWIGIDDAVGAIYHAIVDGRCRGPLNTVAPVPVSNAEFAETLGRVLGRPAIFPVPAAALRLAFGRMADETLLASTRALPAALLASGYEFRHSSLAPALRHALGAQAWSAG